MKSWIAISFKSRFRSFRGPKWSRGGLWTLTIETWMPKMELWRVYRPVVADSNYFDEEQNYPNSGRLFQALTSKTP
jgi:hypothetical protein